jgi:hypothetical protein
MRTILSQLRMIVNVEPVCTFYNLFGLGWANATPEACGEGG